MTTKLKSAARAVCDVTEGLILATVEIATPPERVFRALTDPNELPAWWGSDDLYRTTKHTADLRVGGKWRSEGKGADGSEFAVEGEYLEIDAPRKLVLTWVAPWDGGNTTTITYRLEPIEGGTRVTVRHQGFAGRPDSCRGHSEGWESVLGWLTAHAKSEPTLNAIMVKLFPPRPTFIADMTDAERAIMMQHQTYWREKLAEGRAIVFGPVADPNGGFGLGVIRAESLDAVKAFEASDPAILAKSGFRYEVFPMLRAVF